MLWAIISAILVLQPDRRATQHNTGVRFIATLIGGAASVSVVASGSGGFPRSASLVLTCTLCAALALEEGLRPRAWPRPSSSRPDAPEPGRGSAALDRILSRSSAVGRLARRGAFRLAPAGPSPRSGLIRLGRAGPRTVPR
jgi:hypothetical protein